MCFIKYFLCVGNSCIARNLLHIKLCKFWVVGMDACAFCHNGSMFGVYHLGRQHIVKCMDCLVMASGDLGHTLEGVVRWALIC